MSDEATVLTDEADGVLVITINRPEAKNAVTCRSHRGSRLRLSGWRQQ
ncbi:MAG: hypothetical protein CM15mP125_1470 [Gammaproteobacteria bacterium]|nr:MAG: hypothetical protein CM15mP125_1470 [Gammaproteobacteria bacterium]